MNWQSQSLDSTMEEDDMQKLILKFIRKRQISHFQQIMRKRNFSCTTTSITPSQQLNRVKVCLNSSSTTTPVTALMKQKVVARLGTISRRDEVENDEDDEEDDEEEDEDEAEKWLRANSSDDEYNKDEADKKAMCQERYANMASSNEMKWETVWNKIVAELDDYKLRQNAVDTYLNFYTNILKVFICF